MAHRNNRPMYHAGMLESGISKSHRPDTRTAGVTVVSAPGARVRGKDPVMRTTDLFERFQLGNRALSSLLELANLGPRYETLKCSLRSDSATGYKEVGEVTRLVGLWVDEILRCPEHVIRTK